MNNAALKDNSYRLLTDHLMLTLMPRDALFYAIWCCSVSISNVNWKSMKPMPSELQIFFADW